MIKSLLEPDEIQPEKIRDETEENTASASAIDENFESHFAGIEASPSEPGDLSEISEFDDELICLEKPEETTIVGQSLTNPNQETFNPSEPHFNQSKSSLTELENYKSLDKTAEKPTDDEPLAGFPNGEIDLDLSGEMTVEELNSDFTAHSAGETENTESFAETANEETTNFEYPVGAHEPKIENTDLLFQSPAEPESLLETARKSGLAYAAAITLFASVVFCLIIGWFADLLLGSSPWGIVLGIVLGAVIGFLQFFRITSQIFKK